MRDKEREREIVTRKKKATLAFTLLCILMTIVLRTSVSSVLARLTEGGRDTGNYTSQTKRHEIDMLARAHLDLESPTVRYFVRYW